MLLSPSLFTQHMNLLTDFGIILIHPQNKQKKNKKKINKIEKNQRPQHTCGHTTYALYGFLALN
jgi:hypothetical protein